MSDDETDDETDEEFAKRALAAWTDDGRQPDGLDGNDAWEWAANMGVEACERLAKAEERARADEREQCARILDEIATIYIADPNEAVEFHRKRWQRFIRSRT